MNGPRLPAPRDSRIVEKTSLEFDRTSDRSYKVYSYFGNFEFVYADGSKVTFTDFPLARFGNRIPDPREVLQPLSVD